MTASLGLQVPFEKIARINAVFKQLTGRNLNFTTIFAGDKSGVGFAHEI